MHSAARRWPPALREEQCREWTAELAVLRDEPGSGLRRFTFALSLALSPAPDDGSGLRGWRELLPGFGARLRPAAVFAVLSLLVMHLWPVRFNLFGYVSESGRSLSNQVSDFSASPNLPLGMLLAWAFVPLCYLIGRRSTVPTANPVAVAGVVTTGAALGYLAYRTVPLLAFSGPTLPQGYVGASLVFVALTTPLLAGVLLVTARRGWVAAIPLVAFGLPLMAVLSWTVGRAVSPGRDYDGMFFDPLTTVMDTRFDRGPFGIGEINAEESLVGALLLLGAMVTAYGFGLAARSRVSAGIPTADSPGWAPARTTAAVGCVAVVVGLAAWVYASSLLRSLSVVTPETGDELRWAAVILAVLGVRVAAARRRGATLAAFLVGGWLLAAQLVLARQAVVDDVLLSIGPGAAAAVIAAGLAWWVPGPHAHLGATEATAVRRSLAVAAVVAAACGPLLVAQADLRPDIAVPAGLTVVLGVVPAMFVVLAAFAAAAARRRPVRPALAARLAVVPAAATAAAGFATSATGVGQGVMLLAGAAGAGLFAVGAGALALAEPGRAAHRGGWAVAAVLAPFVLAPVALYAGIVPGMLLRALVGADPYSTAASFQPGVLLAVLPAAAVLARWLIPGAPVPYALQPDSERPDAAPA
ncbi:hypothetical protein ACFQ1L_26380 [Phytohabitans flavus]|uniref:hypothetical protein n=1 Tax=Phytohabitans flavus TaxID=1076124 RepID=UPI00362ED725